MCSEPLLLNGFYVLLIGSYNVTPTLWYKPPEKENEFFELFKLFEKNEQLRIVEMKFSKARHVFPFDICDKDDFQRFKL